MKLLLVNLVVLFSFNTITAQPTLPFILQDEQKLEAYKQLCKNKDKNVIKEVYSLIAQADKALQSGPYSVTFQKRKIPPSGDIHDYMSQAP